MEFYTASEDVVPEEVKAGLQYGPLTCRPRFVVFAYGERKFEIDGANMTLLDSSVTKYASELED